MVIQFSIGNYRSFNEIQTINFRATGLVSEDKAVDENNIAVVDGQRLLKTIGVYGANASGKSNLVKGFGFFCTMISASLESQGILSYLLQPNKQKHQTNEAGYFQIVLLLAGKKYRYGFSLKRHLNRSFVFGEEEFAAEWLFGPAEKNETFYFIRNGNEITINHEYFSEGLNIPYETKLRPNALFLSFCSSYNGGISGKIMDFVVNKIGFENDTAFYNTSTNYLVENGKKNIVLYWLNEAGLIYNDIAIDQRGPANNRFVLLRKNVYDGDGEIIGTVKMELDGDESDGTKKYYSLIGKLYSKFENGGVFISDEIDGNFHPALLQKIISLFNTPSVNKANAQLLFTSHDTNLMSPEILRRDQFYFTEKSTTDSTLLYSLADLKGIRNNADFARQYLAGYYGALPVLGSFIEESSTIEK